MGRRGWLLSRARGRIRPWSRNSERACRAAALRDRVFESDEPPAIADEQAVELDAAYHKSE